MKKKLLWIAVSVLVILGLLVGGFGCKAPAPAPTPTPIPKSTPTPTPTPTPAPTPPYYAGKTISLVVAHEAGGGVDVWFRALAPYLEKFLPGNPTVIIRNEPAGGGTSAANSVYEMAKPDGLTALGAGGGVAQLQWLGATGVKFDLTKMRFVLAVAGGPIIQFGNATFFKDVREAKDLAGMKGLRYGGAGATQQAHTVFLVAAELLSVQFASTLWGMSGGERILAVVKGAEANITAGSLATWEQSVAQYRKEGTIVGVVQNTPSNPEGREVRHPRIADVPTVMEVYEKAYGKQPSGTTWEAYKLLANQRLFDKYVFLPPGTPQSIVDIWWEAGEKLSQSTEVKAALIKIGLDELTVGTIGEKRVKDIVIVDTTVKEWLMKFLSEKYGAKF